jgi:hypothetical protein
MHYPPNCLTPFFARLYYQLKRADARCLFELHGPQPASSRPMTRPFVPHLFERPRSRSNLSDFPSISRVHRITITVNSNCHLPLANVRQIPPALKKTRKFSAELAQSRRSAVASNKWTRFQCESDPVFGNLTMFRVRKGAVPE